MRREEAEAFAASIRVAEDPITLLAAKYRVDIEFIQRIPGAYHPELDGPSGYVGCSPWDRKVYVESHKDGRGSWMDEMFNQIEYVLHELMHVVCYIPVLKDMRKEEGIDGVCEASLLMPFERVIGRICFPDDIKRIVEDQEVTLVEWGGCGGVELGEFDNYEYDHRWKSALRLAQRIGLLDADLYPTFELPDWKRVPEKARRSLIWG